jgi:DNA-3-methyladenine glycosylase II
MADRTRTFTIEPQGEFSLRESVEFGFGQRHSEVYAGVMRLAFVLDGAGGAGGGPYRDQVGVVLRQDDAGVHGAVSGEGDVDGVRAQVARVLSLDVDGRGFADVGRRDPVIGRLQQLAPGLRPPQFYSPYEAAVWSVLSARRPARQMAEVRARLSAEHGRTFTLDGVELAALPTPEQLLAVDQVDGLTEEKVERMHGVAHAAQDGRLDPVALAAMEPADALAQVQTIKGIGPFYAELIVVRSLGLPDALPGNETRLLGLVGQLYGRGDAVTPAELAEIAEHWRPFRTWAAVLIRAATSRLPG